MAFKTQKRRKLKSQLLDDLVTRILSKHYSPNTAETYRSWCADFLIFWCRGGVWRHPRTMGRDEVQQYLTHLAITRHVSANTQNLAFQSVLFLYRELLGIKIEGVDALRAKRPQREPTYLSIDEVRRLLNSFASPQCELIAKLCYGGGLRIGEAIKLRLLDLDIDNRMIQKLLGHTRLETTMIYTHISAFGPASQTSPLDMLDQFVATIHRPQWRSRLQDKCLSVNAQHAGGRATLSTHC